MKHFKKLPIIFSYIFILLITTAVSLYIEPFLISSTLLNATIHVHEPGKGILIEPSEIDNAITISGTYRFHKDLLNQGSILIIPKDVNSIINIIPQDNGNATTMKDCLEEDGDGGDRTTQKNLAQTKLYPNPTKENVTIASNDKNISSIYIYNRYGKELLSEQYSKNINATSINLSKLKEGLYIIKIYLNNGDIISKNLVKQ